MRATLLPILTLCLAALWSTPAQPKELVGMGGLLSNDAFATIHDDRWRTGARVQSFVFAGPGTDLTDARFGDVLELRLRGELITPSSITRLIPGDRPYAGALSFGVHSHFKHAGLDLSLGADVVLTGPQTRLDEVQDRVHQIIDVPGPSDAVRASQLPNATYLAATAEASRQFALGNRTTFRPFVELQAGVETLARVGGDLHFGRLMRDAAAVRDQTTGFRYHVERSAERGLSFVLGGDLAYVADSVFLPASRGVALIEARSRLRAGVHWQTSLAGRPVGAFYGVTWLGKEFDAQTQGQAVGSFRLYLSF